ncbi:uncharacterized protein B0P05DRAFT_640028 [Gilbertella persicaria]|uniref:uncharacterized protein n=1 Tax=Gilbertella persicaria TaxID=101096 RepID=UPI00221ED94A|nr:uncharacterized protein B0P05DRAFT_640028 [Gilbertella persicaria]KAI8064841.1 hypothetical protein B0P05DRAFT_640028 [Gilbertella persicaria]
MLDIRQLHKNFVTNEKEPYLILFVYEYINEIKQSGEETAKLQELLVTRHKNYLNQNRPEIKNELYAHLDLPIFRALIKKRKREHNDVDTAPVITAVDDVSGDTSLSASSSSTITFDRRNSFPTSVLSSSANVSLILYAAESDELVDKLRSIRETAHNLRQQEKKLNAVQNLCLNHIYFVSPRRSKSVGQYMSFDQHTSLLSLETVALPKVPSSIDSLATANLNACYEDAMDEMETIIAKSITASDRQSKQYASALGYIIPNIHQWSKEGVGEIMFIESHFTPMVTRGEKLNIYQMEAKTPEANKGNLDFVKLANNMKVMVDELVFRGCPLEAACSYGTLIHGHQIMNYKMRLYKDGVYLFREISVGHLPEAYNYINLLVKNMQPLVLFKEEIKTAISSESTRSLQEVIKNKTIVDYFRSKSSSFNDFKSRLIAKYKNTLLKLYPANVDDTLLHVSDERWKSVYHQIDDANLDHPRHELIAWYYKEVLKSDDLMTYKLSIEDEISRIETEEATTLKDHLNKLSVSLLKNFNSLSSLQMGVLNLVSIKYQEFFKQAIPLHVFFGDNQVEESVISQEDKNRIEHAFEKMKEVLVKKPKIIAYEADEGSVEEQVENVMSHIYKSLRIWQKTTIVSEAFYVDIYFVN